MKYLKQFNFISEYDSFVNSEDYVTPNVSFIVENEDVRYDRHIPSQKAGDVVYYANGTLNITPLSSYNESMGTAVGVIVIPSGMLPDGKARMIGLHDANNNSILTIDANAKIAAYKELTISSTSGIKIISGAGIDITSNNFKVYSSPGSGQDYFFVGNANGNYMKYTSDGKLMVNGSGTFTGTITARELYVGPEGGTIMSYSNGTLSIGSSLTYSNGQLTIDGNGTFSGALSAATGTFAGRLSAATGTFAGELTAATGSFSGAVNATSLAINGTTA